MDDKIIQKILVIVKERLHYFETFQHGVIALFTKDPRLNGTPPILHSIKSRVKHSEHLMEKIQRKNSEISPITAENVFERVTDIVGVRILHLCQQDFKTINACVQDQINRGDWVFHEQPKAYTWDPESRSFFESFGLDVQVKESFYTSIHYVVRPRPDSEVRCEIQVRTLFEEIWAEIDHQLNYPAQTKRQCHPKEHPYRCRHARLASRSEGPFQLAVGWRAHQPK